MPPHEHYSCLQLSPNLELTCVFRTSGYDSDSALQEVWIRQSRTGEIFRVSPKTKQSGREAMLGNRRKQTCWSTGLWCDLSHPSISSWLLRRPPLLSSGRWFWERQTYRMGEKQYSNSLLLLSHTSPNPSALKQHPLFIQVLWVWEFNTPLLIVGWAQSCGSSHQRLAWLWSPGWRPSQP